MSRSQQAVESWLKGRVEKWRRLDKLLQHPRDKRIDSPQQAHELVDLARSAAFDLSLAREMLPNSHISQYLESLSVKAHDLIYRSPQSYWREIQQVFSDSAPRSFQRLKQTIFSICSLFIVAGILGWILIDTNPELASLFASDDMIRTVQQGELWTDGLLNIIPSSILSISIIANNVMVTFFAFALGAFYGLGTLYIITLNGLMLGGIFAFVARYNLAGRLFEFVIAHGVVELSVICLAGAAGARLGEALIRPGNRPRRIAFQKEVAQAGHLLVVGIPFLIGAGIIEGYISPNEQISFAAKAAVGLSYGVLFWMTISGMFSRSQTKATP